MPIQDVALKTNRERWTIEKGGGRGLGRSALAVQYNDDDDDDDKQYLIAKKIGSNFVNFKHCPVDWGCRIHRLPLPYDCSGYDTKQSEGEVPGMLELWEIRSNPLLPSFLGPLWPGVVKLDKGPIYGLNRTKPWFLHYMIFAFKLGIYAKQDCLK